MIWAQHSQETMLRRETLTVRDIFALKELGYPQLTSFRRSGYRLS